MGFSTNPDALMGLSRCPLCQLECGSREQLVTHVYQVSILKPFCQLTALPLLLSRLSFLILVGKDVVFVGCHFTSHPRECLVGISPSVPRKRDFFHGLASAYPCRDRAIEPLPHSSASFAAHSGCSQCQELPVSCLQPSTQLPGVTG